MYSNLLRQDMMRNIAAAINKYPLRTKWNYYHGGSRIIAQQTKCLQSSNQSMPIFARNLANDSRQSYPGCKPGTRVVPSYPQPVVSKSQPKVCTPPTPPPKSAGGGGPCDPFDDPQKKKRDERIMIAMIAGATAFALAYFLGLFDKKKYKEDANKVNLSEKKFSRPKVIPRNPEPKDIPKEVPYLLIGGGTASFAAFRAIKSHDPKAKVLVITKEGNYPYMRPPLSKEMWLNQNEETTNQFRFKQWNGIERSLFYEPSDFYAPCTELMERENGGVSVALGYSVEYIDVYAKKVYLDTGDAISYEKCLIATGSKPRNLPILKNAPEKIQEKITLFRSILDFQEIDEVIKLGAKNIAIIGSGFLGSELACSLARKGKNSQLQVYQVFREPGNMGKVLPEYLSNWTTKKVREEGVNVIPNTIIESAKRDGNQLLLTCSDGNVIKADHVIVAVGAKANTDLAIKSDLEIDEDFGGYLVNAELMARSNLWVAGDCTCFYDVKLGRRRVEHHDHAVISGRLAGENMTGAGKPYWHQSMFWSDLGPDVGYEAIGIVDSHLPTVGVFAKANESDTPKKSSGECDESGNRQEKKENEDENKLQEQEKAPTQGVDLDSDTDYGKGVIFYLCEGLVVGIVLWNVFNRISIAREVLKEERKYDDLNEVAKLFNIHNRDVEDEEEILEEALKEVERREEEKKKLSKNSES